MITKANILAAAASIAMGPGGVVNFAVGCSIARTATGTYNVLVDEAQTVPPTTGFLMATMDGQPITQTNYEGGTQQPVVTHVGDNFTGTAASPTTAGPGVDPQTLFTLQTVVGGPGTSIKDFVGNLLVEVTAVGGGNPSAPQQTGV